MTEEHLYHTIRASKGVMIWSAEKKGSGQITYVPDRKSPWRASVGDGQGKQKSRFFKNEKEAKAFLREVNADANKLKSLVETGIAFDAFSQVFLDEKRKAI